MLRWLREKPRIYIPSCLQLLPDHTQLFFCRNFQNWCQQELQRKTKNQTENSIIFIWASPHPYHEDPSGMSPVEATSEHPQAIYTPQIQGQERAAAARNPDPQVHRETGLLSRTSGAHRGENTPASNLRRECWLRSSATSAPWEGEGQAQRTIVQVAAQRHHAKTAEGAFSGSKKGLCSNKDRCYKLPVGEDQGATRSIVGTRLGHGESGHNGVANIHLSRGVDLIRERNRDKTRKSRMDK